jgi:hypothetical protein
MMPDHGDDSIIASGDFTTDRMTGSNVLPSQICDVEGVEIAALSSSQCSGETPQPVNYHPSDAS